MEQRMLAGDLIVFVPGILGSRLVRGSTVIWGGAGTIGSLRNPARLALAGSGSKPDPSVKPCGLVGLPVQIPGLAKFAPYRGLLGMLDRDFASGEPTVLEFAYDWRLSCLTNARLLEDWLTPVVEERRKRHSDAGVTFVAHSMGGLVVEAFVTVLSGAGVTKRVISLATPFRGAAKAFNVMSNGPRAWPYGSEALRKLLVTFPSVYELLPRYRAIVDGSKGRRALRHMQIDDLPDDAHGALYESASDLHTRFERQTTAPVSRTVLAGVGQRTPQFAESVEGRWQLLTALQLPRRGIVDLRGDGTVPRQSVAPADWHDDTAAHPVPQSHVAIPNSKETGRVLTNVLTTGPRAAQAVHDTILSLDVDDVVRHGAPLDVRAEILGDRGIEARVSVVSAEGVPEVDIPVRREDGVLRAVVPNLPSGDHIVTLRAVGLVGTGIEPTWDVVTVCP